MKFNSIDELLDYTKDIVGKTFYEIDSENLLENTTNLNRNKGILGHVVESGFYKYPIKKSIISYSNNNANVYHSNKNAFAGAFIFQKAFFKFNT